MKLQILVEMPHPAPEKTEKAPVGLSIEDKVRDALDCIDSGYDSRVEWLMINKLYSELQKRKQTPRVQNLRKMIEPVLAKFGYHGVSAEK